MRGEAMFFHDLVGGGENRARGDNFSENHSTMMMPRDLAQPPCQNLTMSLFRMSRAVDPRDDRHSIPLPAPPAFNVPSEIVVQNPPPLPDDTDAAMSSNNQPCTNPDEPPSPNEKALDTII